MILNEAELKNFRNIEYINLSPAAGINLIYGDNAQGKTNILESIWLFTGCKSFRGSKDRELVKFGEEKAVCSAEYTSYGRHTVSLEIESKRTAVSDGIELKSAAGLMGNFSAVVFSPTHLSLIKNGPADRRKFIDAAVCQLRPVYAAAISKYNKILSQRNSLLKDIPGHSELLDILDVWDSELCKYAAEIINKRREYVKKLAEAAGFIYSGLSAGKEKLSAEYISSFDLSSGSFEKQLLAARKNDILNGSTSIGPHRDDIDIKINGISARAFASQGQQRSAALALKTAEGEIIKEDSGEYPVILLDDVLSELDAERQEFILSNIRERQVFITCCDPDAVKRADVEKKFHIKNGKIID